MRAVRVDLRWRSVVIQTAAFMSDYLDRQVLRMFAWLFGGLFGLCGATIPLILHLSPGSGRTVAIVLLVAVCVLWAIAVVYYWGPDVVDHLRTNLSLFRGVFSSIVLCGAGLFELIKRVMTGSW
jgi:hypothetical protein